jgi:hypothetical protein
MAQLFGIGQNGFLDSVCKEQFVDTMTALGTFVACPRDFKLSEPIRDAGLANILVNEKEVPRYTCAIPGTGEDYTKCAGASDTSCPGGAACVETWTYCAPGTCVHQGTSGGSVTCSACGPAPADCQCGDAAAVGGYIGFAPHYDPCTLISKGQISIELVYVTP